jgi:hypothetical protein
VRSAVHLIEVPAVSSSAEANIQTFRLNIFTAEGIMALSSFIRRAARIELYLIRRLDCMAPPA